MTLKLEEATAVMAEAPTAVCTTTSYRTGALAVRIVHPLWPAGSTDGRILTAGRSPKVTDIKNMPSVVLSWQLDARHVLVEGTATICGADAAQQLRVDLAASPYGYAAEDFWSETELEDLVAIEVRADRIELLDLRKASLATSTWRRPK